MKLFKILAGFIIFYFVVTAVSGIQNLAGMISQGNQLIEYAYYGLLLILAIMYLIVPIIGYSMRPSLQHFKKMVAGEQKATKKIIRFMMKQLPDSEKSQLKSLDREEVLPFIRDYIEKQTLEMDAIINKTALKLTAGVMISPNPFIDGMTILFGNSKMIYTLTQKVKIRYTWHELIDMYFAVLTTASATGLLEEFDEVIEDIFQEIADEFAEFIGEETGKTIGDSVPFLNVLVKASSPIIQAAGNYAFVLYNGKRFKYSLLSAISKDGLSHNEIKKKARKEARKAKYKYIEDMVRKLGKSSSKAFKNNLSKVFKKKETEPDI